MTKTPKLAALALLAATALCAGPDRARPQAVRTERNMSLELASQIAAAAPPPAPPTATT
jgi:hypothetical protein